eukprot:scaffold1507_cov158-Ochromonas_danica.AAC.34
MSCFFDVQLLLSFITATIASRNAKAQMYATRDPLPTEKVKLAQIGSLALLAIASVGVPTKRINQPTAKNKTNLPFCSPLVLASES